MPETKRSKKKDTGPIEPQVIPRAEHPISRSRITESALKVLYRLKEADYASLLVGGCVRDLMLGREPKDFDVVTNASPDEIRDVFRNSRLVGRRFRLAHVRFGRDIVEVATFRARPDTAAGNGEGDDDAEALVTETGRLLSDNVFGTHEEDALRRDFTVNALYYDIRNFSVIDYVGGVADLKAGLLRTIGDPETRFREDPVRMLRAVRFAAKCGLKVEAATEAPLFRLGELLLDVPPARLYEEVLKLLHGGAAAQTFELLRHYGLFGHLFPATEACLAEEEGGFPHLLIPRALANTDQRIAEDKPVTPAFLLAVLLWAPLRRMLGGRMASIEVMADAASRVLAAQAERVAIPKRISAPMREIWYFQPRLERRSGRQAFRLLEHPRFRAAYDFLVLRAGCGEADPELAAWWTGFQAADVAGREEMVRSLGSGGSGGGPGAAGKRRRRRRRGACSPAGGETAGNDTH